MIQTEVNVHWNGYIAYIKTFDIIEIWKQILATSCLSIRLLENYAESNYRIHLNLYWWGFYYVFILALFSSFCEDEFYHMNSIVQFP